MQSSAPLGDLRFYAKNRVCTKAQKLLKSRVSKIENFIARALQYVDSVVGSKNGAS